jgi:GDPmannose 4,6-dehydratase
MFACNGILFNHESPLRGETFVTRKITRGVSKIALGLQDKLWLGNLNARRDWGHAKDYVEGMYLILQQDEPDDYVLATGITTEIREFLRLAFEGVGIEIEFKGKGIEERGYVKSCSGEYPVEIGKEVVAVDPKYFRPTEVELLLGDPTKAKNRLGWSPKYDIKTLCREMIEADLMLFKQDKILKSAGFEVKQEYE